MKTKYSDPKEMAKFMAYKLGESLADTLSRRSARLFAIDDTNRGYTMIDYSPDPYELFETLPTCPEPYGFVTVMTGHMTKIDPDTDEPEEGGQRMRVRVFAAVNDNGMGVFVEYFDEDGKLQSMDNDDAGEGAFPDILSAWWKEYKSSKTSN
jgi:hypothetical protein